MPTRPRWSNITGAALCTGLTECGGILEEMHGWLPSAGVADGVRKSKLKLKILAVLRAWMAILLLTKIAYYILQDKGGLIPEIFSLAQIYKNGC